MEIIESTPEDAFGPLNSVERKNAPEKLFMVGQVRLLSEGVRVSIIGSRNPSFEGIERASALSKLLVEKGVCVMSGLAVGIDTAAHWGAIKAGGSTIAVVGTPVDQIYPLSNYELCQLIARDHLLVSQFPIGSPSDRTNFPQRNRTMALLSEATVIVEARENSGTLHQGWEALRLGRPLYILDSVTRDESLTWPDKMISRGARLIIRENVEELIEALPTKTRGEKGDTAL